MPIIRWILGSTIALIREVVGMFGPPLALFFKFGAMASWLIAPFALMNVWMAPPGSAVRETSAVINALHASCHGDLLHLRDHWLAPIDSALPRL